MSDPIVTYLQQHLDEYVADLGHLSAIDSGTDDKAGVDAVQDWLMERLQRARLLGRAASPGALGR